MLCRSLFVHLTFSFSHWFVCPSSINGFNWPFWYLQAYSFDYGKRNIPVVICDRHSVAINQAMKVTVRLYKWWLYHQESLVH